MNIVNIGIKGRLAGAIMILAAGLTPNPVNSETAADRCCVYLLLGLTNIFSLGLNKIDGELKAAGVHSVAYNHLAWRGLVPEISKSRNLDSNRRIVIVGHSAGANAAAMLANRLSKSQVDVDLLVTVDATSSYTIGENTKLTVNYFIPPTGKMMKKSGSNAIKNIDARAVANANHFNIDDKSEIQKLILDNIKATLASSPR